MSVAEVVGWVPLVLDVAVIGLLGGVLWRLGGDPAAAWCEYERRLRAISDGLRTLVAQAEGVARDLDRDLAAREERLRALLAAVEASARPSAADDDAVERDVGEEVRRLAAAGRPAEDIARRLGLAVAEVRLLTGLRQARATAAGEPTA